ncbi:MAG TPA: DUF1549 domain-containing protein, partial [Gemmataceae bacterium]|nr:DUF1549 domain-containing protein [Gemmataceae bacterium]
MMVDSFRSLRGITFQGLLFLGLGFAFLAGLPGRAALPDRGKVIGQPTALVVQPATVAMTGPGSMQQLVVTGRYADGSVRDLTPYCDVSVEGEIISVEENLFLVPKKNGSTALTIKAGGQTVKVPVTVSDLDKKQPASFRNDLIAVLNVGGCNSGACHGTPSGKNGFKLSLRGYDPAADYIELTRDVFGRRTDNLGPEASMIYLKALGKIPHEGGQRFPPNSIPAQVMHRWLSEGLRDDAATLPVLKKVEVLPGNRLLNEPARTQQLSVQATFADGKTRDVTRLSVFTSSDTAIASVTANGLVEFNQSGEVAILVRYLEELIPVRLTFLEPKDGFKWSIPPENNYIDKHIFAKLKMLSIQPSELCSDQEFIRRATMDVCGVLPTAQEVKTFLDSKDKDKRAKLIDALLERDEYSDFWTLKWSDVFRSTRKTIQLKGTFVFQKWLRGHITKNTPLDKVIHDVITANGSTFANPAANYYRIARDPSNLAETTAQLFLGIRMQCAKCHNHPFERWTQDDYYSLAAFFARVKQRRDPLEPGDAQNKNGAEYIFVSKVGEVVQPRTQKTMPPRFMGGEIPKIDAGKDRREVLASWLTSPKNPFFAKSIINRVWYHLLGRGVVDPVDDFRDSNPSANDELLDALAKDFGDHKFDVKYMIRTIMNSRTYQLSAQTNDFNKDDNKYFSHAVTKLHTAEQLFDALCNVTEVPEKFPGMPLGTRSVQLPDGEVNNAFLKTFGQPARELACECERESDSNLAQALQLINGPAVNDRLRNPNNRIGKLLTKKMPDRELLNELFLATLSRLPGELEAKAMLDHCTASLLGVKVITNEGGAQIEKEVPGTDKKGGVTKDSPADKAGLKPGDVIRKIDGVMLPNADQFHTVLAGKAPGAVVSLVVTRNGQEHTFKATLAADKRKAWEDVHWALIN